MKRLKEQLKHITVMLCLCVLAMVGANTKLAAQDGCPPQPAQMGRIRFATKNVIPIARPSLCAIRFANVNVYQTATHHK